jgi:hypothetical protein
MNKILVHSDSIISRKGEGVCSIKGHIWIFASGNSGDKTPEGLTCVCGYAKLKYIVCTGCGNEMPIGEPSA